MQPPSINQALRVALEHHQAGRLEEAVAGYSAALRLDPDSVQALNNLGNVLKDQRKFDEAIAAYSRAIQLQPSVPELHYNMGRVMLDQRRFDPAAACFSRAIQLRGDHAGAYCNMGVALAEQGKLNEAIAAYEKAIELKPAMAEARNNLGNTLKDQGRLDQAIAAYDAAIEVRPGFAEAHANLGNALKMLGKLEPALAACARAIELKGDDASAHAIRGAVLKDLGRLDDAVVALRRAIELQPGHADAHVTLGNALKDQGLLDQALAAYDAAMALRPGDARAHSNRVYLLNFHPRYDAAAILAESRRWNTRHAAAIASSIPPHANDRAPQRRLRIGYVSPDFRDHAQSLFTLALFTHHDRHACEIFCYSDVAAPDPVTERLKQQADVWRTTAGMSDRQLAEQIREDRIDILFDLTSHTGSNRLLAFAAKPAPVQATWLGYPGTTGLQTMDWRLSDPYLDPPGWEARYSERTIRLPQTYWCYASLLNHPPVNDLPAARAGHVTFGCFNNICKINGDVLRLWADVLCAAPQSRLLLVAPEGSARARIVEPFLACGIHPSRIEFAPRQSRDGYFALYHRIDITLDPFPYNGHTTSLDSLWMGVPLVTLAGATCVGRAGLSQLTNLGQSDLAAETPGQYVQIAATLAADIARLTTLRSTLRPRLEQSPLMDAPRFARDLEAAQRYMWREWCGRGGGEMR